MKGCNCHSFYGDPTGRSIIIQPGAVKLVLWRHWMHLSYMHPVTSEDQFLCTRLYYRSWGTPVEGFSWCLDMNGAYFNLFPLFLAHIFFFFLLLVPLCTWLIPRRCSQWHHASSAALGDEFRSAIAQSWQLQRLDVAVELIRGDQKRRQAMLRQCRHHTCQLEQHQDVVWNVWSECLGVRPPKLLFYLKLKLIFEKVLAKKVHL